MGSHVASQPTHKVEQNHNGDHASQCIVKNHIWAGGLPGRNPWLRLAWSQLDEWCSNQRR